MPADELIDYLVSIASIQVRVIPELLGSFDSSAATAIGVIMEEYIRQVVESNEDATIL